MTRRNSVSRKPLDLNYNHVLGLQPASPPCQIAKSCEPIFLKIILSLSLHTHTHTPHSVDSQTHTDTETTHTHICHNPTDAHVLTPQRRVHTRSHKLSQNWSQIILSLRTLSVGQCCSRWHPDPTSEPEPVCFSPWTAPMKPVVLEHVKRKLIYGWMCSSHCGCCL